MTIKPCPFCGEIDGLTVEDVAEGNPGEDMAVICPCGATGPWYGGSDCTLYEDAIELWNKRK